MSLSGLSSHRIFVDSRVAHSRIRFKHVSSLRKLVRGPGGGGGSVGKVYLVDINKGSSFLV